MYMMLSQSLAMPDKFEFEAAFEPQNLVESRPILELTFQASILSNDNTTVIEILQLGKSRAMLIGTTSETYELLID